MIRRAKLTKREFLEQWMLNYHPTSIGPFSEVKYWHKHGEIAWSLLEGEVKNEVTKEEANAILDKTLRERTRP